MKHRLVPVGLALALSIVALLPASAALTSEERFTDRVLVDAGSGERLSQAATVGGLVSVEVRGVEPGASGFGLEGPGGWTFANQSSRADGTVVFWDVPVLAGEWTLSWTIAGQRTRVVDFVLTDDPPARSASSCLRTTRASVDCSSGCSGYAQAKKLDEALRWTPVLVVNSPSGGEATASSTWQDTESLYVGGGGWESRTRHSEQIEAEDGASLGFFRLAKWGIYQRSINTCGGGQYWKDAKVIDWAPRGYVEERTFDLTGPSRFTDADNPTRVQGRDHRSLTFDVRYHGLDRSRQGRSVHAVEDREIVALAGKVTIGSHRVGFDLIRFEVSGEDTTTSYTYRFEDRHAEWYVHELADSPGWAFCRPSHADCAGEQR